MATLHPPAAGVDAGSLRTPAPVPDTCATENTVQVSADLAELVRGPAFAVPDEPPGFLADLMAYRAEHPGHAKWFDALPEPKRADNLARLRRRFIIRSSELYAEAHAVYRAALLLHRRIKRFEKGFYGVDATCAIRSIEREVGPTGDECSPSERLQPVCDAISGYAYVVGALLGELDGVSDQPARREGGAR